MTSVESLPPSYQLAPLPATAPTRGECGCCHRLRDFGHVEHAALGQLCVWCSLVFDPKLDHRPRTRWLRYRHEDACANCIEQAEPCELHAK